LSKLKGIKRIATRICLALVVICAMTLGIVGNEVEAAISVATLGVAADKNGTSPWTALTGLSISAGDTVFVLSAGDSDSSAISVIADGVETLALSKALASGNPGNAFASVWIGEVSNTSAAWYITITNTSTAKAMSAYKVTGIDNSAYDRTVTGSGSTTPYSSDATATLTQADELVIGLFAVEDTVTDMNGVWTTGVDYVSGNEQKDATDGAGDASNMTIYSAMEIVSSTAAQTATVTNGDDADYASMCLTYKMAAAGADISNAPAGKAFGVVATSTDYWSSGSAPTWPLDDAECYFTVTNNSGGAVSITIEAINFTGGVGWTLAGSPGENIVTLKAAKSGDANEAAMVTLTTSGQAFISGLAGSATKKWEVKMETPTIFGDGVLKESTITLTATLD